MYCVYAHVREYAYVCACVYACMCIVCACVHECVCTYVVSTNRLYRSKGVWLLSSGHKRHCFCPPLFNHAGGGREGGREELPCYVRPT